MLNGFNLTAVVAVRVVSYSRFVGFVIGPGFKGRRIERTNFPGTNVRGHICRGHIVIGSAIQMHYSVHKNKVQCHEVAFISSRRNWIPSVEGFVILWFYQSCKYLLFENMLVLFLNLLGAVRYDQRFPDLYMYKWWDPFSIVKITHMVMKCDISCRHLKSL